MSTSINLQPAMPHMTRWPLPIQHPVVFEVWIRRQGHAAPEGYVVPAADPCGAINRLAAWLVVESDSAQFFAVLSVHAIHDGIPV